MSQTACAHWHIFDGSKEKVAEYSPAPPFSPFLRKQSTPAVCSTASMVARSRTRSCHAIFWDGWDKAKSKSCKGAGTS